MPYPIHPSGSVLEHSEPLQILKAITSEPLLHLRTEELAMKYIIKLRVDPSNPTYTIFRHQPSPCTVQHQTKSSFSIRILLSHHSTLTIFYLSQEILSSPTLDS